MNLTTPITALLAGLVTGAAWAQPAAYLQQPLKRVVGFAAGGPSDIEARAFAVVIDTGCDLLALLAMRSPVMAPSHPRRPR